MKCGIYSITNKVNGKLYIGYTGNFRERWCNHKRELRQKIHANGYLQNAWNKYGEGVFKFERIELCNKHELIDREHYWCKLLKTHNSDYGYNTRETGKDAPGLRTGIKHTEETKRKISENRKGKCAGEENPFYGKKHTDEWKKVASEKRRGKPNMKLRGRKATEEHRRNLSKSHKGYIRSEESRRKQSSVLKNSVEARKRIDVARAARNRAVVQIDLYGNYVNSYTTIKQAAEVVGGDHSGLRKCCDSRYPVKVTKGFYWMYKEEYYENIQKEGGCNHKGLHLRSYRK